MRIRERKISAVRWAALCVMFSITLIGCSWRPDRNAAEANLKGVKSLGVDLGKYYEADPRFDSDARRIKKQKIERAIKLAEKLVEVSR